MKGMTKKAKSRFEETFVDVFLCSVAKSFYPYLQNESGTEPTFNSCTKCVGSPAKIHGCTPDAIWFPGYGYMDDLTTERRFNSQAMRVIDMLGLFYDILFMVVCTTRYSQMPGRLVQELNVCTVLGKLVAYFQICIMSGNKIFLKWFVSIFCSYFCSKNESVSFKGYTEFYLHTHFRKFGHFLFIELLLQIIELVHSNLP